MSKLAIAVLVTLVLALLALPPALGTFTRAQVHARVAELERSDLVDAQVRDYARGWFSSTARLDVSLTPAYAGELHELTRRAADPRTQSALARLATLLSRPMPVLVRLSHGPVMLHDGFRLGVSSMVAQLDPERTEGLQELLSALDVPYVFEFRGHTGFDGALRFDADVPPVDHAAGGERLLWSGVRLDGTLDGRRLRSRAQVDRIELESDPWLVRVEGFAASGDNVILSRRLLLGSLDMRLDRAVLALDGQPLLEAGELSFASDVQLDSTGTLVDMQVQQSVNLLRAGATRLTDAAFGMTMRNMDVQAMQALPEEPLRELAAAGPLDPLLARALSASPTLALDPIRFHLDGEPFEARAAAAVDGGALPADATLDPRDGSPWTEVLSGTAGVTLSKALAERLASEIVQQQLRASSTLSADEIESIAESQVTLFLLLLEAQGYLRTLGDHYTAELSYADGTLRINDRPLPRGLIGR